MKNFILAFLIFLVWTTFGLWIYSWLTPAEAKNSVTKNKVELNEIDSLLETENQLIENSDVLDKINNEEIEKQPDPGLIAKSVSNETIFSFDEGFSFKKDSVGVIIPNSTKNYKNELKSYLDNNPNLELHILSVYSPLERLEELNLGFQRGSIIAKKLEKEGIDKNKIVVESVIEDIEFNENDIYSKGISFHFHPLDEERIASVTSKIVEVPKKLVFYPKFSETGILQDDKLEMLMYTIKDIMDADPGIKLIITGHTDDVGDSQDNHKLGLNYAKDLRWYLKNKGGISVNRISVASMGEFRPLRNNKTAAGRNINRRVELQFVN